MVKHAPKLPSPDLTSFAALLGDSFAKRIHLLTQIVQGAHYPSIGRYKEKLLSRLIGEYLPKSYEVGTGFVLFVREATDDRARLPGFDPLNMGSHCISKQCDIIVYDSSRVPVVFRDDDFVIVRPDSVKAIIEVKGSASPKEVAKILDAYLDFGRKWRECQHFYLEHHQTLTLAPDLYAMCWEIGGNQRGQPSTNGAKLREQIARFYKERLGLDELVGFPRLSSLSIYNECIVSEVGVFEEDQLSKGFWTESGQFIRHDSDHKPYREGDCTIAALLGGLHYALGETFNRFYSRFDETREPAIPYKYAGYTPWLTDEKYIRDSNTDFVDRS